MSNSRDILNNYEAILDMARYISLKEQPSCSLETVEQTPLRITANETRNHIEDGVNCFKTEPGCFLHSVGL